MMAKKRKVLLFGDSNTYGYDPSDPYEARYSKEIIFPSILQEMLGEGWQVIADGMNGRTLPSLPEDEGFLCRRLNMLTDGDIFAVMLGTNDVLLSYDCTGAVSRMDALLSFLTEKRKPEDILVIAPPHIGNENIKDPLYLRFHEESKKMNEGFMLLARQSSVRFLDAGAWGIPLAYDMVHFSGEGHRLFAENLARYIENI